MWSHVQRLLQLRAQRSDLRTGRMEHLQAGEQSFVYRRGRTVVALNNDTTAVTIRLPLADAAGRCVRRVRAPARPRAAVWRSSCPPERLRLLSLPALGPNRVPVLSALRISPTNTARPAMISTHPQNGVRS